MAQLNSTVIHGALNVTADISGGAIYSNGAQCVTANDKTAQNNTTADSNYRVLLSNSASNTDETAATKKSGNLCFNPNSGLLSTVKADLSGSAGTDATLFTVTDTNSMSSGTAHHARFYASNMATGTKTALLVGKASSTKNSAYMGFYYAGSGSDDNYLRFGHYAADNQMIIKANGNVGIGTTAPDAKLVVNGTIKGTAVYSNGSQCLTAAITSLATGSSGSGNVVSSITVSGNTITYVKGVTALTAVADAGSNTKGLVNTGAQTFAGTKTFSTGIKVSGASTMGALTITGAVSGTSFTATSSRKAKKDISPTLLSALDIIKDTEIVDFKYINDTEDIPHVGFIAEDTPEILSSPEKDRMDMVNCIGILLKAVQEITKGMADLEKQVNELKK